MRKKLYAVYDTVAGELFGGIVQEPREAPAIRAFYDALGAQGSPLASHPDDYNLLELGELDTETGLILPVLGQSPITVATGRQWRETVSQENEK